MPDPREQVLQDLGSVCTTWGCGQAAARYVSCEGEGTYPYCDECAATLLKGGEIDHGIVRGWKPCPSWTTEQPQECTVCGEVLVGREVGFLPIMCEEPGCPGPPDRLTVLVRPYAA